MVIVLRKGLQRFLFVVGLWHDVGKAVSYGPI